MACPTCGHTMALVAHDGSVFHCSRCGTVVADSFLGKKEYVYCPWLVDRCRKYQCEFDKENVAQYYRNTWFRLGIAESIGDSPCPKT